MAGLVRCVFLLASLLPVCCGTGMLDFLMVSYSSDCRDTANKCDIYFTFCFDTPKSSPSINSCAFHRTPDTDTYDNQNNIQFGSTIGGIANPIRVNISTFSNPNVMVVIRVMDENTWLGDDHKITVARNLTLSPAVSRGSATYSQKTFSLQGHTFVYKYQSYCINNYSGPRCDCLPRDDQSGHYTCSHTQGKVCRTGWEGSSCTQDINECERTPGICDTGTWNRTCSNTQGSHQCITDCHDGWTGENCDQDVDECVAFSSPCQNGGTCRNTMGSYRCVCPSAWSGPTCTEDVDECSLQATSPCNEANTAECRNLNGSFQCVCLEGWRGENCEQDVDECGEAGTSLCDNGGNCSNTNGSYRCDCPSNWSGPNCQEDADECAVQGASLCTALNTVCKNLPNGTGHECVCQRWWRGENCEEDIDECQENDLLCQNGGTCVNYPGRFTCMCATGWNGGGCQLDINECRNNPCHDGARCENVKGSYQCYCADGSTGCARTAGHGDDKSEESSFPVWPIILVIIIIIIIAVVIAVVIFRRRRRKHKEPIDDNDDYVADPSIVHVTPFHPSTLTFENTLYHHAKSNREPRSSDVIQGTSSVSTNPQGKTNDYQEIDVEDGLKTFASPGSGSLQKTPEHALAFPDKGKVAYKKSQGDDSNAYAISDRLSDKPPLLGADTNGYANSSLATEDEKLHLQGFDNSAYANHEMERGDVRKTPTAPEEGHGEGRRGPRAVENQYEDVSPTARKNEYENVSLI